MPDPRCVTCGGPPHVESDCPRPEHRQLIGAMWSFDGVVYACTKGGWLPLGRRAEEPSCAGCNLALTEGQSTSYCSSKCSCLGAVWCIVCWNKHIDRRIRERAAEPLWQLLDDIDTLSDVTKGDFRAFYTAVMKVADKRHSYAKSFDGQTLVWNEPK